MTNLTKQNYKKLEERILSAFKQTDLEKINQELVKITKSTICLGVGGNFAIAILASKILEQKNKVVTTCIDASDFNYFQPFYDTLFVVSHRGRNHGIVSVLKQSTLQNYLLSNRKTKHAKETLLTITEQDQERSFIAIANTLIPMSILMNYYTTQLPDLIHKGLAPLSYQIQPCTHIEILTDYSSKSAATFLETSIVEAGIATCVVHTKYNYCHGRTTLSKNIPSTLIFYQSQDKELDSVILQEAQTLYQQIIILKCEERDPIISDFLLTLQSSLLLKDLAKANRLDLAKVKYASAIKKLYHYKGAL